ncbi:hypothetical protein ABZZ74_18115 [Streptomyces sp. NPDC006476]|uniref:hypothetical protein n=1 Tax=Streptomyces sp. NPDC006476 TaxID=3157175 RepID=UPI0033BEF22B
MFSDQCPTAVRGDERILPWACRVPDAPRAKRTGHRHWAYPPDQVQALLPKGLVVDEADGTAP